MSVMWAVVPSLSYEEAGRTLAYLAVFAGAVALARLAPRAGPVAIQGILLAALAATAYALASRVWPGALAETELSNRLGQPFQYWNAVGTTAALAVPGLLWLGARREDSPWVRALAYPAMGAAVLAILLTQSRGALAAGTVGAIIWLAWVPLRLRSLAVLAVPTAGAAALAAWALSQDAFSASAPGLAEKESVATEFGLLLVLLLALLYGAGVAVNAGLGRWSRPAELRRRAGIAALSGAALLAVITLAALSLSDRGLTGTISDRVDELTSETETAPTDTGAGRFTAAASTRGKYWREARLVFEARPSVGTGAGTFRVARLRYRTDTSVTGHAHGYVSQTLADLGLVGLGVSLLLLGAWLVAAARGMGIYPRSAQWSPDRIALVALALMAIVFGLQSAVDWTWFVPGPAAMAFVAAGFVAGRGPARDPEPAPAPTAAGAAATPAPPRLFAGAAVLLTALLCAWAIWQPESADRATTDGLELSTQGDADAALDELDSAADANPLSAEVLLVRAAVETQDDRIGAAGETLEEAVLKFPGEPNTWYRLATFQLGTQDRPEAAAETVQGALYLDPLSEAARALFLEAKVRARAKQREAQRP